MCLRTTVVTDSHSLEHPRQTPLIYVHIITNFMSGVYDSRPNSHFEYMAFRAGDKRQGGGEFIFWGANWISGCSPPSWGYSRNLLITCSAQELQLIVSPGLGGSAIICDSWYMTEIWVRYVPYDTLQEECRCKSYWEMKIIKFRDYLPVVGRQLQVS